MVEIKIGDIVIAKDSILFVVECDYPEYISFGGSNDNGDQFYLYDEVRLATEEEKKRYKANPFTLAPTNDVLKERDKILQSFTEKINDGLI